MLEANKNQAVRLVEGEWKLVEEDIPVPGEGEILIKVHYSPINPFDVTIYGRKLPNYSLGVEGAGVVEKVGSGVAETLIGKKVAFFQFAFRRYAIHKANGNGIFYLDDDLDLQKAATLLVTGCENLQN